MRCADIREGHVPPGALAVHHDREMDESARERDEQDAQNGVGHFGRAERQLFEHELLHEIVIGMGRLDDDGSGAEDQWDADEHWEMDPGEVAATDPTSPFIQIDISDPGSDTEHAILGRLSSMSLMAAVTASGKSWCWSAT